MRVAVTTRGGAAIATVEVSADATVSELKRALHAAKGHRSQFAPARQRLTFERSHESVVLADDATRLKDAGIAGDGFQVLWKDLGPQIGFRPVYVIEYLGPLVLYPLLLWARVGVRHAAEFQQIAAFLWVVHFLKRELETLFVHEFGALTMPVRNVFKNSLYYWGFGALLGWVLNSPARAAAPPAAWHTYVGFPWFCVCMLLNLVCHLQLRALRTPGSSALAMPRGFLFEFVTAPNYLLEILMWTGFNVLTGFSWAGLLFNAVGAAQMLVWAREKHGKYRKLFKNYPRSRKILIPFIY